MYSLLSSYFPVTMIALHHPLWCYIVCYSVYIIHLSPSLLTELLYLVGPYYISVLTARGWKFSVLFCGYHIMSEGCSHCIQDRTSLNSKHRGNAWSQSLQDHGWGPTQSEGFYIFHRLGICLRAFLAELHEWWDTVYFKGLLDPPIQGPDYQTPQRRPTSRCDACTAKHLFPF